MFINQFGLIGKNLSDNKTENNDPIFCCSFMKVLMEFSLAGKYFVMRTPNICLLGTRVKNENELFFKT